MGAQYFGAFSQNGGCIDDPPANQAGQRVPDTA